MALAYGQPLTLNDPGMAKARSGAVVVSAKLQQTNNTGGLGAYNDAAARAWGSSIATNSSAFTLTRIAMKLGNFSGATATGSLTCYVYHAASNLPVGSPLAKSTNGVVNSTLSNSGYPNGSTDVDFYFADYAMTVTNYAIVLNITNAPTTTAIFTVRSESVSGPNCVTSTNGAPWGSTGTTFSNWRWYFIAYGY